MNKFIYTNTIIKTTLLIVYQLIVNHIFAQNPYWQQKADYDIAIDMNVVEKSYTGTSTIVYTNHSPDTLFHVYFHLYYNAFQPGSLMDIQAQQVPDIEMDMDNKMFKMTEREKGKVDIWYLSQNDQLLQFSIDGTILTAMLAEPVLPGQSVLFRMEFFVKIPRILRRAGFDNSEGIDFSMAQWYPKICMYDDEGWHAYPYLGREFYSNFGDYQVDILIDSSYVVAAGADQVESYPVPGTGKKLWRFISANVIDFAWAADPRYTTYTTRSECGTIIYMYYLESFNKDGIWQKTGDAIARIIPYINQRFGNIPYSTYTVIQAGDGGMEYPKCTFITGDRGLGSLVGVTIHELMHSWFQSAVATNELKYSWMDEGFVSFATTEIKNYMGANGLIFSPRADETGYEQQLSDYRFIANSGYEEAMNTPANFFQTSTAYYLSAYTKGELFLKQMEYILGKKSFDLGLKTYYETWKFRHPKPDDFQKIMEKTSGIELDWYFHFWLGTTHYIDLEVAVDTSTEGLFHIYLMNKGKILMPVDLLVEYTEGVSTLFYIPVDLMQWPKDPDEDVQYGQSMRFIMDPWAWPYVTYVIELSLGADEISKVTIDPGKRLVDLKPENNVWINK